MAPDSRGPVMAFEFQIILRGLTLRRRRTRKTLTHVNRGPPVICLARTNNTCAADTPAPFFSATSRAATSAGPPGHRSERREAREGLYGDVVAVAQGEHRLHSGETVTVVLDLSISV